MKPVRTLDCMVTPEGRELVLYEHGDVFLIQIDGYDLMSSRAHGSEEELARMALAELGRRAAPKMLIGGLGMGFTLRAALDELKGRRRAVVVVAEVFPAVVEWNRGVLGPFAGRPLEDPRVRVETVDVGQVIARKASFFDAILLDVDNGPEALTLDSNRRLYTSDGLASLRRALVPDGVLAIWSAGDDTPFCHRLRHSGFSVSTRQVRARASGKGLRHVIFLARNLPGDGRRRTKVVPPESGARRVR